MTCESPAGPDNDLDDLVQRVHTFVEGTVEPIEQEHGGDIEAAGGDTLRRELQREARDLGLLAPHAPLDVGGLGLGMTARIGVFEAAGRSLFGPVALNVAAPDEGNIHLLDHVATPAQRSEFLAPLAAGEIRTAFAMSEPGPGAGSDPAALQTRATQVPGGGWSISGKKRFITGADGAELHLVMARTSGEPGEAGGATIFLVPAATPGVELTRHLETLERSLLGGHCEVTYSDVRVSDEQVLGGVDRGFAAAQVRLAPARMTHVMRWLGAATRAHEVAVEHVAGREAFGSRLSEMGMMQQLIADNEIDLAATRALLVQACTALDAGSHASMETSITKTFASEALFRVVDRAVQMCGGLGVSGDLVIARTFTAIRAFRIYDGPSEVHRWSIARRAVRRVTAR